jgi:DNA repair protein RadD
VEFCALIDAVAGARGRVFVLVHRDEILQQTCAKLRAVGVEHGIVAPDYPKTDDRVQVASVMSLTRRLNSWRGWDPALIVIDEAHHAVAVSWKRILSAFPDALILGVTATPRRLDSKPLDDVFETFISGPPIAWFIDRGYLSPVTTFTPANAPDLSQVHIRAGDYATDELAEVMSNGMIVDGAVVEYSRLCPCAPAIAFCVDIRHSKLVAAAFAARGYRAKHVDGDTLRRQRRQLIAALDRGNIDILCNCSLISEGLDVPGVEAAILLRPTKSLALYLQMVGRALRPGKPLAFVLDHAGNCLRHGLPTARRRWSLHGHQQRDNATDGLRRCHECGAINPRDAEHCEHCGAPFGHGEREPRVIVPGRTLVEAIETPVSDQDLVNMSARDRFRWAAGEDGRLVRERLQRIAIAKNYQYARQWSSTMSASRGSRRGSTSATMPNANNGNVSHDYFAVKPMTNPPIERNRAMTKLGGTMKNHRTVCCVHDLVKQPCSNTEGCSGSGIGTALRSLLQQDKICDSGRRRNGRIVWVATSAMLEPVSLGELERR